MTVSDSRTVLEEASLAFEQLLAMEQKVKRLHQEMAERTDYESDDYHALIQRATDMQEQLHFSGIHTFEAEAEKTLLGLGFERGDFDRPTSEFSGGVAHAHRAGEDSVASTRCAAVG